MKLFLFGGAEPKHESVSLLTQLMNEVLAEVKPKQVLHIPYARMVVPEGEEELWGEGWVQEKLKLENIDLLDARSEADLARANQPFIFMNGGPQRDNLYDHILGNKKLYELVMNANYVMGESAGSMVCAEYRRTVREGKELTVRGLGILKGTIIEAHYTERARHQLLRDEIKEAKAKYGIGIDSVTGIIIETSSYPYRYDVIGNGLVEFLKAEDLVK